MGQQENDVSIERIRKGIELLRELADRMKDPLPLRPGRGHAPFRRRAARLRSGQCHPPDVPAEELAAALEQSVLEDDLKVAKRRETVAMADDLSAALAREMAELRERNLAAFHELKRQAKGADPDSPIAQETRRLQRAWRKEGGRGRG